MDGVRWERIQAVFNEATEKPASERRPFLEAACGDDPDLLAEVLDLLEEESRGGSLLDQGVAHLADRVLGAGRLPASPGTIGRYRLTTMLGEGGMGTVYLAEREDLGHQVAVKVLRDAWLSPARRDRFTKEQRILAQLNHPSIARIYDANVADDGTPWFAMEYVQGVPLTQFCRSRACPIQMRLQLFHEVCDAVLHAHQHLVVHCDLKPGNILVRDDGKVKLLDFGIARQFESLERPADHTRTAFRLMTPAYAAPEQLRAESVGIYSDIYSLGVILYELLTLKLPFDLSNLTALEAERLILDHTPAKPSILARVTDTASARLMRRSSWEDLDVICLTAMHKDTAKRYRSVDALIQDLGRFRRGEPLEARPDTLRYRAGKFVLRNLRPVIASILAAASLIGLVAFYTMRLAAARNAALAAATRANRVQRFTLDLFEGGDKEAGPKDGLRVTTLIDRGLLQARSLDREPEVQAELYETLGGIYQKLGKLEQADALLRLALERYTSLLGPDHILVAKSLVALGRLRNDQARYEEAETLIRKGLDRSRRASPPDGAAVADAMFALGLVLESRGAYEKAIPLLEDVVRMHSVNGKAINPDLAADLYELANAHFYAGNYSTSESLNQRALAMNRELYGDRHPSVADELINLGAIAFELGRYQTAEQYYRQALAITREWFGDDHYKTATNLVMLSRALVYQDRNDEATALLQRALATQERVHGSVHPAVASILNEMGNVAVARERYRDAEAAFGRMLSIYRSVYPDGHYLVGVALANLGSVYMNENEFNRAEKLFRQAIDVYGNTLPADHLNVGITRIKLGRVLLRQGHAAEAERESLAGYEILARQTEPSVSFLRAARHDLAIIYDDLHQADKAAKFRAELAAMEHKPPAPPPP